MAARFVVFGSRAPITGCRIRPPDWVPSKPDVITSYSIHYTKLYDVAYRNVNLNDDPEIREAIRDFSQCAELPHLYVRGRFAGGGAAIRDLARSGGLKPLFDQAGIAAKASYNFV